MEYFKLNNDTPIPALGVGFLGIAPEEAESAATEAFPLGYSFVDVSGDAANAAAVGAAIAASGTTREEMFVSANLAANEREDVAGALAAKLADLGLEYLDLVMLEHAEGDDLAAWRALEDAASAGTVRSLGLSGFAPAEIREIAEKSDVAPALVRLAAAPACDADELAGALEETGALVMAWYPLSHGDAALLASPAVKQVADERGLEPIQVVLRWHVQLGNVVVADARPKGGLGRDIDIFEFDLTADEMQAVSAAAKLAPCYAGAHARRAWTLDFN